MPELPEAERARQQIERALGREIVAVDDTDTYVCRPHAPGEIASALTGRRLTHGAPARQVPVGRDRRRAAISGCTSGMAGRIVIDEEPDRLGPLRARVRRRRPARAARQAPARPRGDRARLRPCRPGCRRGLARRLPRARRPRHDRVEGAAARPGLDLGRRQPARRRDALARAAVTANARRRTDARPSSTTCGACCAPRPATRSARAASTPAPSSPTARAAGIARAARPSSSGPRSAGARRSGVPCVKS